MDINTGKGERPGTVKDDVHPGAMRIKTVHEQIAYKQERSFVPESLFRVTL